MEHRAADYFVKGRQLEKLGEELERVEAFYKLVAPPKNDKFDIPTINDKDEQRMQGVYGRFSEALRELKYLVEDIGKQKLIRGEE